MVTTAEIIFAVFVLIVSLKKTTLNSLTHAEQSKKLQPMLLSCCHVLELYAPLVLSNTFTYCRTYSVTTTHLQCLLMTFECTVCAVMVV